MSRDGRRLDRRVHPWPGDHAHEVTSYQCVDGGMRDGRRRSTRAGADWRLPEEEGEGGGAGTGSAAAGPTAGRRGSREGPLGPGHRTYHGGVDRPFRQGAGRGDPAPRRVPRHAGLHETPEEYEECKGEASMSPEAQQIALGMANISDKGTPAEMQKAMLKISRDIEALIVKKCGGDPGAGLTGNAPNASGKSRPRRPTPSRRRARAERGTGGRRPARAVVAADG